MTGIGGKSNSWCARLKILCIFIFAKFGKYKNISYLCFVKLQTPSQPSRGREKNYKARAKTFFVAL